MSSLFLDAFGVDKDACDHGRWVTLVERNSSKVEVFIRRTNSVKYKQQLEVLMEPHKEALTLGILESDIYTEVIRKAAAKSLILDWRGIKYDDSSDEEIPFSSDRAEEYFTSFPDFFELVFNAANAKENFMIQDIEKAKAVLKKN